MLLAGLIARAWLRVVLNPQHPSRPVNPWRFHGFRAFGLVSAQESLFRSLVVVFRSSGRCNGCLICLQLRNDVSGRAIELAMMLSGRSVVGGSSIRDLFKVAEVQRFTVDLDLRFPFPAILDPRNALATTSVVLVFPAIPAVLGWGCQPKIAWVVVQAVAVPMVYM